MVENNVFVFHLVWNKRKRIYQTVEINKAFSFLDWSFFFWIGCCEFPFFGIILFLLFDLNQLKTISYYNFNFFILFFELFFDFCSKVFFQECLQPKMNSFVRQFSRFLSTLSLLLEINYVISLENFLIGNCSARKQKSTSKWKSSSCTISDVIWKNMTADSISLT